MVERYLGGASEPHCRSSVAQVGMDEVSPASGRLNRLDRLSAAGFVASCDRDVDPRCRQGERGRPADTAGGTGDKRGRWGGAGGGHTACFRSFGLNKPIPHHR